MARNEDHDAQPCHASEVALSLACAFVLATSTPHAKAAEQPPVPLYAAGLPTGASLDVTDPPGSLTTCPAPLLMIGLVSPGCLIGPQADRPSMAVACQIVEHGAPVELPLLPSTAVFQLTSHRKENVIDS